MLGLGLKARPTTRWWPDGALYAADFTLDRYMIGGVPVSRSTAFTFTRNSPKLAQDSQGNWQSFGVNVPAITDRGLLLEPERQNTVINSTSLEWWNMLRATVTSNVGPGLDGNGADLLTATETNVNGAFAGANAQTVVPGSIYTFSTILRRTTNDWIALVVTTNDNTHRKTVWFNLATVAIGNTHTTGSDVTLHASGITLLPGNLLRPWLTFSTATITAPVARLYVLDANGLFSATTGAAVLVLHGQMEPGTEPTSPVATVQSSVSRAADLALLQLPQSNLRLHVGHIDTSTVVYENCPSPFLIPVNSGRTIAWAAAS